MPKRILLIGGGAREHAIGAALTKNPTAELYTIAQNNNPGLRRLSADYAVIPETHISSVVDRAKHWAIDLAVVGLEDPLAEGLVDQLQASDIPTVGPTASAARLESSKLFTRQLMDKYSIDGRVEYHYFDDSAQMAGFLSASSHDYALKPVGLTAGQGVKVMGVQLASSEEAIEYGRRVINNRIGGEAALVVEERLIGSEFTLQAFVDANCVRPMPLVRDYKKADEGERGPNTGSMGSYSQPDHLLPFVSSLQRDRSLAILEAIISALRQEGIIYRGVIYGQFMVTQRGIQLVEINARFGDPEAINVLSLLKSDFLTICEAITSDRLREVAVEFEHAATVCTYVTPPDYGRSPRANVELVFDAESIAAEGVGLYFAKVDERNGHIYTTRSRSAALLGQAGTVQEAGDKVDLALTHVKGQFHVRRDIGVEQELEHSPRTPPNILASTR